MLPGVKPEDVPGMPLQARSSARAHGRRQTGPAPSGSQPVCRRQFR